MSTFTNNSSTSPFNDRLVALEQTDENDSDSEQSITGLNISNKCDAQEIMPIQCASPSGIVENSQSDPDCVEDDPVCRSGSADQQTKKRKAPEKAAKEPSEKRQKTSTPREDVIQEKRKRPDEDEEPRKRSRASEQEEAIRSSLEPTEEREADNLTFEEKYQQMNLLGKGAFGSVYAGYRMKDHIPVAIKHIQKDFVRYHNYEIPMEVAVLQRLTSGQEVGKSAAVSLLDYYEEDEKLILVLERPVPAVDLLEYMLDREEGLKETESRPILKQLIEAALELQSKDVFHRDIKLNNILIETHSDAPRIRLIDFGISCFTKDLAESDGTPEYFPAMFDDGITYIAGPTTVRQIGDVLYELMHWGMGQFIMKKYIDGEVSVSEDLSTDCKDMLRQCLAKDSDLRPSLEKLRLHPWLKESQSCDPLV